MRYRVWDEEDQKERTLDECITPMEVGTTRRVQIKKGKPKRVDAGVHSVIISHIEEHSKKPAETRNRIIRLLGGGGIPKIELFARQSVEGWDCWGNEV